MRQRRAATTVAGALFLWLGTLALAQTTTPTPEENPAKPAAAEATIVLSPFEVTASSNEGYVATSSLAGSRLKTDLKDMASAIQVITPKFLEDTGATNISQVLVYTTNTEIAGVGGNYFGSNAGDTAYINKLLTEPHKANRVRGLNEADLTRDFFLTDIGLDSYNINQIDIQRGPNSVLYGLGSPAGIINYSLKVPNMAKNKYVAELRVGQYNKHRESIDADQALLPGTLGIRVNALNEARDYEQKFKYEKTRRGTVALRWTPRLADSVYTQFTANYEHGKTDSNHPRVTPPVDFITNWFATDRLNKWVNPNVLSNGAPSPLDKYVTGGPANNWWDSLGLVYGDPATNTVGIPGIADAIRQRGGNPWSGWVSPNNPNWSINGTHVLAQKSSYANNPTVLGIINGYESTTGKTFGGFGGWPDQEILDQSIFDARKESLEGPNSSQFNKFNAVNLTFVQTYLNGKAGVEVVYDHQDYRDGYQNLVGGTSIITVDINPKLRNGAANPNLGRPFFVDATDGNITEKLRESVRVTAFYKFDFKDVIKKDNLLTQALGSHIFTGVAASQKAQQFSRSFNLYRYDAAYTANDNDDRVFGVNYLGGNLTNANIADGLHIQGLQTVHTPPAAVTAMVQGKGSLPDWSVIPVGILDQTAGLQNLYNGASASRDQTTTKSLIWQSRFFSDTVVGLFGWRDDNYYKIDKPQNVPTSPLTKKTNPFDPAWSWDAGIAQGRSVRVTAQKTSWGIMLHTPEFIKKHLPWGTSVSFGINEASNFRPSDVSQDIYGKQNPAPSGKSRDYSLLVTTLDERLTLRVTKYKTSAANTPYKGTAPSGYDIAGVLARTMDGLMTETYLDGNTFDASGNITAVGRQNTTPESIVNKWLLGSTYDTTLANTPLPTGWTVATHPELLTQPLRIRASAASTPEGTINPATGVAYTEPPITPAEATYRRAWFAAQPDSNWYRPFGQALFQGLGFTRDPLRKWGFWPDSSPAGLKQISDTVSEGLEFEVNANLTKNLRVIFNASKDTATATNIMSDLGKFIVANRAFWHDGYSSTTPAANYWQRNGFADIDFWGGNNSQTFSDYTNSFERKYLIGAASEGRPVDELRTWHWNAIATYDFRTGPIKGLSVGGAVRWSDKAKIGYYPLYLKDIDVWISDLDKPIYASAETNYDLWIGYKRKLSNKVDWRVQLNIRDLFAKKGLIPTQANPDGTIGQARLPASTSWEISNRFEF